MSNLKFWRLSAALICAATLTLNPSMAQAAAPPTATTSKVMVIFIENHSREQVEKGMPKLMAYADSHARGTEMKACTSKASKPNYICTASGGMQGEDSNRWAVETAPDVFYNSRVAGRTAKTYVEGMGSDRCRLTNNGKEVFRHTNVMFIGTSAKRASCEKYVFDSKYLESDVQQDKIPNVGWLIPNNCNNAHDNCPDGKDPLRTADDWIAAEIKVLQNGPAWQSGNLTVVITADEDDNKSGNSIPLVVLHPGLEGVVVDTPVNLYSLGGFMADLGHTPRLGQQATAPDFADAFGLQVN